MVALAVYFLNISHTKSVTNMTRYKEWFGRKPNVSHLQVFRCLCLILLVKMNMVRWIRIVKNAVLFVIGVKKDVIFDEYSC